MFTATRAYWATLSAESMQYTYMYDMITCNRVYRAVDAEMLILSLDHVLGNAIKKLPAGGIHESA